jgi:limonene-1,2-epoxide hydrolase
MPTAQIADRLVELCRQGQFETAQKELFADNAVSVEPTSTPEFDKETRGLRAIIDKGHKFEQMTEKVHNVEVSDPVIADNSFACTMRLDITMKGQQRMDMTELCVYKVKDDKIVEEAFFM